MLRFAVYDKGGPAPDWPLDNAYLLGPDDEGRSAERKGNRRRGLPGGICARLRRAENESMA